MFRVNSTLKSGREFVIQVAGHSKVWKLAYNSSNLNHRIECSKSGIEHSIHFQKNLRAQYVRFISFESCLEELPIYGVQVIGTHILYQDIVKWAETATKIYPAGFSSSCYGGGKCSF